VLELLGLLLIVMIVSLAIRSWIWRRRRLRSRSEQLADRKVETIADSYGRMHQRNS
jgi:hypothetical protein